MSRRGSSFSADLPSRPITAVLLAGVAAILVLLAATSVGAESPLVVAEDLAIDGVYVAPGRDDLDEVAIAGSIQEARVRGLRLVVVAPNDPQPDPAAFARRILEASDADAALVFPTEGGLEGHVVDQFESASLRALAAGRSKSSPVAAVDAFTEELLAEPSRALPPIVGQVLQGVLLLALVLAGVVILEQFLRRMFGRPRTVDVERAEQRQSG